MSPLAVPPGQPSEPAGAHTLKQVCSDLGLEASPGQIASMLRYLEVLQHWNQTYNLTSVRDPQAMLTQHLADCLAAVAALERAGAEVRAERILDVGSGGGLPGVLLALFRPGSTVICIDAVAKKAAFIRQVAGGLGLANLRAEHGRVESRAGPPCDLVTARAFATLAELIRLTRHTLAEGGQWMAMKGQVPEDELAELPPDVEVFHVEPLNVPGLEARRCLVWMRLRRDT